MFFLLNFGGMNFRNSSENWNSEFPKFFRSNEFQIYGFFLYCVYKINDFKKMF